METSLRFSPEDIAYIEANFIMLQSRPENGPAPSYVLEDGRAFYPPDYFELETDEARFKERLYREMRVQRFTLDPDKAWRSYLSGVYGVCLRCATPENIVRKNALLERVEQLICEPQETNRAWTQALKDAVDELDALERPFSPHYDRSRFGRPLSRDSYIADVRRRFPQIV